MRFLYKCEIKFKFIFSVFYCQCRYDAVVLASIVANPLVPTKSLLRQEKNSSCEENYFRMRVLALISGGKDSIFAMHVVHASGHDIVVLGHISPSQNEPDSEMYQSVASEGVHKISEALEIPLLIQATSNVQKIKEMQYSKTEGDEVEDLFLLLERAKIEYDIDAISCGALLSDYQRVRVENICSRLGLVNFAPLWQKDQSQYLEDLEAVGIDSVIVKVAAIGLKRSHLGQRLANVRSHLEKLKNQFGVHPAGEGGELESFVLDAPMYKRAISIDKSDVVTHSDDFDAPVLYLKLQEVSLQPKEPSNSDWMICPDIMKYRSFSPETEPPECGLKRPSIISRDRLLVVSGLTSRSFKEARSRIEDELQKANLSISDIIAVQLYLRDLSQFGTINVEYSKMMGNHSPTRTCVEIELPPSVPFVISLLAFRPLHPNSTKSFLHVESRSNWASCIVGPYSQAVVLKTNSINSNLFYSGLIGLKSFEHLMGCGSRNQSVLAVSHRDAITINMLGGELDSNSDLDGFDLAQFGFVTTEEFSSDDNNSSFDLVVPCLPRGALLEIVPHRYSIKRPFLKRIILLESSNQLSDVLQLVKSNLLYQITLFYSDWSDEIKNTIKELDDLTHVSRQFIFISTIMKKKGQKISWAIVIDELNMNVLNEQTEE